MNKEVDKFKIDSRDLPTSYVGTLILGKHYDLIDIDFERDHPTVGLVRMVLKNPAELINRTDVIAAEFVTNYVTDHLAVCRCPEVIEDTSEYKFY